MPSDFPEVVISAVVQCLRFSRTSLVAFNAFQPAFSLWISLQGDRVLRFYSALLQFGRASSSLVLSLAIAVTLFQSLLVCFDALQPGVVFRCLPICFPRFLPFRSLLLALFAVVHALGQLVVHGFEMRSSVIHRLVLKRVFGTTRANNPIVPPGLARVLRFCAGDGVATKAPPLCTIFISVRCVKMTPVLMVKAPWVSRTKSARGES